VAAFGGGLPERDLEARECVQSPQQAAPNVVVEGCLRLGRVRE
jgi:hypothetical protein